MNRNKINVFETKSVSLQNTINKDDYRSINQTTYTAHSNAFQKLETLTSHLVYRDIPLLLSKHLFEHLSAGQTVQMLDVGCSIGTSIMNFSKILKLHGFQPQIMGVDLNQDTLAIASKRFPDVTFQHVTVEDSFENLGQFDLIVCNFVLVEMPNLEMHALLKKIKKILRTKGIVIVTAPTLSVYCSNHRWYGLNNQFPNNSPAMPQDSFSKTKEFVEDQPVTLQIIDPQTQQEIVTFHDFLHTQQSYDAAYENSDLLLIDRHFPLGMANDAIPWLDETKKPRLRIDVLKGNLL